MGATGEISGTILWLADNATGTSRLQSAFGAQLRTFDSQAALLDASRRPGVELVILPWRDRSGDSPVTTIAAIRASRRSATVRIYADRSAECLHALVSLSRAGATGVIVRDVDDDVRSLRRLLDRGSLTRARERVAASVQRVVRERHLPLVFLCLEQIDDPPRATEFARRLRVSRRTLSAWARKAGAKGVRSLSSKCRVLVAIELIRESGRTLEQVAHELQFASSAHLHNTVRRYTRCAPKEASVLDVDHWCRALFATGDVDLPVRLSRKVALPPRNGPFDLTIQHSPHVAGFVPEESVQ